MKRTSITILFIMICFYSFAGVELVGTTSSNFIKIPPFARAVGMGEAFASISDGTYGLYYNPAGLSYIPGFEVQLTHIGWFQNINYEFFSIVTPVPLFETGKLGLAFAWFQVDEMDKTSELPSYDPGDLATTDFDLYKLYKFSPYDYSIILGYGIEIYKNLSGGISIKYTAENIDKSSGANVTTDAGFIYKYELKGHLLRAGLNLSNLGSELKMDKVGFEPPKILKTGISDQFDLFSNKLLLALQIMLQPDYDNLYSLGFEYWIHNLFALRAGYKFGAFNQPTFGAGVRYKNMEFDYAFVKYDELGNTHRFSLLYSWGSPPVKLEVSPRIFSPNNDSFLDNVTFSPILKSKE
ncbi:MAG TPA: PorV/PorQ family protein, partial [Candidatus Goldiibacteriota bacterium]|nr:PorV/PorQ family protein [Candidatus Goldiibacteriota bacterium]